MNNRQREQLCKGLSWVAKMLFLAGLIGLMFDKLSLGGAIAAIVSSVMVFSVGFRLAGGLTDE